MSLEPKYSQKWHPQMEGRNMVKTSGLELEIVDEPNMGKQYCTRVGIDLSSLKAAPPIQVPQS